MEWLLLCPLQSWLRCSPDHFIWISIFLQYLGQMSLLLPSVHSLCDGPGPVNPSQPRLQRTQEEPLHPLCIPYVYQALVRTTLRRDLSRIKDRDPALKASGVVYEIPYSCGQKYIGETKRALEMRLKEHQAATRRGETEKSAIAEHAWSRHHQPLWEETWILDRAGHTTTLLIKEAIHISLRDPAELLNRD